MCDVTGHVIFRQTLITPYILTLGQPNQRLSTHIELLSDNCQSNNVTSISRAYRCPTERSLRLVIYQLSKAKNGTQL